MKNMKVANDHYSKSSKGDKVRIFSVQHCDTKAEAKKIRANLEKIYGCEVQMSPYEIYNDRPQYGPVGTYCKGYTFTIFLERPLLTGEV